MASSYKVLLIGDVSVGKTSIVHKFCDDQYKKFESTMAPYLKEKTINLDGIPIKLEIWDTVGEERFRSLTASHYRNAMGILLVYDVTDLASFKHLADWLTDIRDYSPPHVSIVLVGNKCESSDRVIDFGSGKEKAANLELPFLEVSCEKNIKIEDAFITLARRIREVIKREGNPFGQASQGTVKLTTNSAQSAKSANSSCLSC